MATAVWWSRKPSGAKRWLQGARAEAATARLLEPLEALGWWFEHDLKVPKSKANWDHLGAHPSGEFLVYLDTKAWHARGRRGKPVEVRWDAAGNRLRYGPWDNTSKLRTVEWMARRLTEETGKPVVPVMAIDRAQLVDMTGTPVAILQIGGSYLVNTSALCDALAGMDTLGGHNPAKVREIKRVIERKFAAA